MLQIQKNVFRSFIIMGGCLSFFFILPVSATQELVQVISFQWDKQEKKLQPLGIGTGIIIAQDMILTSKAVATFDNNIPADFFLICLSGIRSGLPTECQIPAGVTAVNYDEDAVLLRPTEPVLFYPNIRYLQYKADTSTDIRIQGYAAPFLESDEKEAIDEAGLQTLKNILHWSKKGGTLQTGGDKLIVRRGKIDSVGGYGADRQLRYITNLKLNRGITGGGAFDSNRNFIGLVTARDEETYVAIAPYYKIRRWVESQKYSEVDIPKEILQFYKAKLRQPKFMAERLEKIKANLRTERLGANIFPIQSETDSSVRIDESTYPKSMEKKSAFQSNQNLLPQRQVRRRPTEYRSDRRTSYLRSWK